MPDDICRPAYSPELNAMENVWGFLRANTLCNLVRNAQEDILDAGEKAWHVLVKHPGRIRSIGSGDWPCVGLEAGWNETSRVMSQAWSDPRETTAAQKMPTDSASAD